jgi:hypothetical protein
VGRHLQLLPGSRLLSFPQAVNCCFDCVSLQCIDEDEYTNASDDVKQYTIVLPNVLILGPVYLTNVFI